MQQIGIKGVPLNFVFSALGVVLNLPVLPIFFIVTSFALEPSCDYDSAGEATEKDIT